MELIDLKNRALEILAKYSELEKQKGAQEWSRQDLVRGFVGDVGDLAKLTMAVDGVRDIPDASEKLAHELADCLWSIFVIAEKYDIDIEQAFTKTMDKLEKKLTNG